MAASALRDSVLRVFESFDGSRGALDRLLDACAESVVFEVAPTHETLRWLRWDGKGALRAFLGPAYGHARDLRFATNTVVAEGHTVCYQATEFATLNEALHGLPADSRTRQEQVHIFEFHDSLIVSWRMFPGMHVLDGEPPRQTG